MGEPTLNERTIANRLMDVLELDNPNVIFYRDGNRESTIHVLSNEQSSRKAGVTYSTIGLSQFPLMREGKEIDLRVEIIGVSGQANPCFGELISTLAFCVINSKWFCAPGIIFPDAVKMCKASETLSDIYFLPAYLWGDKLSGIMIEGETVAWLLALPIARSETMFAERHGVEELEKLFERNEIDIFDLNRLPVV